MTDASIDRAPRPQATLVGLFVALVGPFLSYLVMQGIYGAEHSPTRVALGLALHWANLAILILVVMKGERLPLSSMGGRPFRWWTIPLGVIAGLVIAVSSSTIVQKLSLSPDPAYAAFLQSLGFPVRVLLVLTAGIFEETLYRGYGLERLAAMWGNKWLAAAVTLVLFTVMHVPAVGWSHVLPVGIVGALVTLLYLWRRDIVINMIAHATIDGIGLLVAPLTAH